MVGRHWAREGGVLGELWGGTGLGRVEFLVSGGEALG